MVREPYRYGLNPGFFARPKLTYEVNHDSTIIAYITSHRTIAGILRSFGRRPAHAGYPGDDRGKCRDDGRGALPDPDRIGAGRDEHTPADHHLAAQFDGFGIVHIDRFRCPGCLLVANPDGHILHGYAARVFTGSWMQ